MLVMPGPPSSRKIGSAGCAERAWMRVTGTAISRECGSRRFSRTIIVPQSAARGPASVLYVQDLSVSCPAWAPFGTLGGSSPPRKPTTARPTIARATRARVRMRVGFMAPTMRPQRRPVVVGRPRPFSCSMTRAPPTRGGGRPAAPGVGSSRDPSPTFRLRPLDRPRGRSERVRGGAGRPPQRAHGVVRPAGVGVLVLVLIGRRWWPFSAPVALWLLAAALSFADGRLVVYSTTVMLAGTTVVFLLGNLADDAPTPHRAGGPRCARP